MDGFSFLEEAFAVVLEAFDPRGADGVVALSVPVAEADAPVLLEAADSPAAEAFEPTDPSANVELPAAAPTSVVDAPAVVVPEPSTPAAVVAAPLEPPAAAELAEPLAAVVAPELPAAAVDASEAPAAGVLSELLAAASPDEEEPAPGAADALSFSEQPGGSHIQLVDGAAAECFENCINCSYNNKANEENTVAELYKCGVVQGLSLIHISEPTRPY